MNILSHDSPYKIAISRAGSPVNWLVSYPRSGNTYLRALLGNYFSGLDRPLDLDEITRSTCGEHDEKLWLELTGKPPAERSLDDELGMRLPYFERVRRMTNPRMPMIKSHSLCSEIDGHPAFRFVPGDRIIHLVRHPCDVAISCAHFYNVSLAEAIDRMLTPGSYFYGPPDSGYEVVGSWSEHTRSWMQEVAAPVHRVRYADLVGQPVEMLMDMIVFLGVDPDRQRAELAVEYAGFERLQKEEGSQGFAEQSKCSSAPYFREGRPGQWLEQLTIEQAMRIQNDDSELIDQLGFKRLAVIQNTGS